MSDGGFFKTPLGELCDAELGRAHAALEAEVENRRKLKVAAELEHRYEFLSLLLKKTQDLLQFFPYHDNPDDKDCRDDQAFNTYSGVPRCSRCAILFVLKHQPDHYEFRFVAEISPLHEYDERDYR